MSIGRNISLFRKKANLTQKQLGDQMSVADKTISNWENDEREPDLSSISQLAKIFNISIDELINGNINKHMSQLATAISKGYDSTLELAINNIDCFMRVDDQGKDVIDYCIEYNNFKIFSLIVDSKIYDDSILFDQAYYKQRKSIERDNKDLSEEEIKALYDNCRAEYNFKKSIKGFNISKNKINEIINWLSNAKEYEIIKKINNSFLKISSSEFIKLLGENGVPIPILRELGMTEYDYLNAIKNNYSGAKNEFESHLDYCKTNHSIQSRENNYGTCADKSRVFIDFAINNGDDDDISQLIDLDIEKYHAQLQYTVGRKGIPREISRYDDGIFRSDSILKNPCINKKFIDYLLINNKKELLEKYMNIEPFKLSAYIIAINVFSNIESLSSRIEEQEKNIELYRDLFIKSIEEIDFNINIIAANKNPYEKTRTAFIEYVVKRNDEELFDKLIEQYCRINNINLDIYKKTVGFSAILRNYKNIDDKKKLMLKLDTELFGLYFKGVNDEEELNIKLMTLNNDENLKNILYLRCMPKIDLLNGIDVRLIIIVKSYSLFVKILSLSEINNFKDVVIGDIKRIKWVIENKTKNISNEDLVTLQLER